MSQSTDAILAFGFDLGEDFYPAETFGLDEEDEGNFDFEELIYEWAGVIYPAGHAGVDSPEYIAYDEAREAAIAACPVDLITHCSGEHPMYFLAVRDTETRAHRGYPQAASQPTVVAERIDAARRFCAAHGIEWQEPQWHIFSMWD